MLRSSSRSCDSTGKNSSFFSRLQINASQYTRFNEAIRRISQHLQDLQQRKDLHLRKRESQYENLKKQLTLIQNYLRALDVTECLLEIQTVFLRKFANEENRLKERVDDRALSLAEFNKLVKKIERSIQVMRI